MSKGLKRDKRVEMEQVAISPGSMSMLSALRADILAEEDSMAEGWRSAVRVVVGGARSAR